jgi:hypothetical protein
MSHSIKFINCHYFHETTKICPSVDSKSKDHLAEMSLIGSIALNSFQSSNDIYEG